MQHRKRFYQFVSIHTFLIGLFPFYLPVFLWKLGYTISDISYFIALAGFGYCLALWFWERIHKVIALKKVILISFLMEFLLLSTIFFNGRTLFFPALAILYGIYNCFFWITNRVLFLETVTPSNSGKHFGNFQIVVAVILKAGVFCGGLLLDKTSYFSVFTLSILVGLLGSVLFIANKDLARLFQSMQQVKSIGLTGLFTFRDAFRSRFIFAIDGLFLFLESFFWVISLFIIVKESYWQLGMLVILLMVIFGAMFYFIKNSIDRMPGEWMYRISVFFYALSWIFRGLIGDELKLPVVFVLLILITFFTSIFRLTFNKRFFDLAKTTTTHQYIFLKSYYSQFFIAILFGILGLVLSRIGKPEAALSYTYFAAAMIALGYFLYRSHDSSQPPP
ncbi:MAG: MFS transporter [bacterium]